MGFFDVFKKKMEGVVISSPMSGKVVALSEVPDPVFADGIMGQGIAIDPTDGCVCAPFDGTVSTLFPTGHAVGLTSAEGIEVLIHVGMDTVKLDGKHFEKLVSDGDHVKQGDVLLQVDIDAVKTEGYATITPIVICDPKEYTDIQIKAEEFVAIGDELCHCVKQA